MPKVISPGRVSVVVAVAAAAATARPLHGDNSR
jgi:hypothetical protein